MNKDYEKPHEFYVNNQPWNDNLKFLELRAAFMNSDLFSDSLLARGLSRLKLIPHLYLSEHGTLEVDYTEGRWKKVMPIFNKYDLKPVSGGLEPMVITIPARNRENAKEKMLFEIKNICGPKYPLETKVHDISITISPRRFQ